MASRPIPARDTLEKQLITLISERLLETPASFGTDSDLYQHGLDSMAIMQLLVLLEDEYGVAIPDSALDATRGFYRDFGLAEVSAGRFATADGGEQLALVKAARRTLLALRVGVDDADDLGRAAASLERLGVACGRDARDVRRRAGRVVAGRGRRRAGHGARHRAGPCP